MTETSTEPIHDKLVFVCHEKPFTVREIIDAAHFRAEVEPIWRNLLRIAAAEAKADAQELEFDDETIDAAVEKFRYEHDLITAEETEKWLADRGTTLADFSGYFVRHYWHDRFDDIEDEEQDLATADSAMRDLLTAELLFSGELDQMAIRLSWRVAAFREAAKADVDPALIEEQRKQFFDRAGLKETALPSWLEKFGRGEEWWREALAMEAVYHRDRLALLSQQARAHELAALRLPLTRFEVETVELDSLDAAREALLCARDDGMTMEEVAAEGRYPYRHPEVLLEEIPEDLQQKFLSVHPGDILDPIARGDGFHLCRIVGKHEPNVEDPDVQKRADQRIIDRHFSELITRHIQWRTLLA
ncbi:MAG: hypothetical protein ACR2G0_01370 [Chthoniobacterales bacterium]